MEVVISLVLLVDVIMAVKIIGSMIRAKFVTTEYINNLFWVRIGGLIIFHVIVGVVSAVLTYIHLIVQATL